jgi:hypothetical protein
MESKKNDRQDDKLRWDLLPLETIEEIIKVYHAGAKKYGENTWQKLPDGYNRYKGAMMRHLVLHEKGEIFDEETGCRHLAQVAWNAIAMLNCSLQKQKELNKLKTIDEMLFEAVGDSLIRGFNNCEIQKTTDEKQKEISDIVGITTDAIQGFAGVKEKGIEEERQKAIKDILDIYHSFVEKLFKTPINFDNGNKD